MGMPLLSGRVPGAVLPEDPGSNKENETGKADTIERVLTVRTPQPSVIAGRFPGRSSLSSSDIVAAENDPLYSTKMETSYESVKVEDRDDCRLSYSLSRYMKPLIALMFFVGSSLFLSS